MFFKEQSCYRDNRDMEIIIIDINNKMKKIFTLLLLLVSLLQTVWAYDFSAAAPTGQTLYFNYAGSGEVSVTSQNSSSPYYNSVADMMGALEIPSSVTYNGTTYSVTSIGKYAFYHCSSLTSVSIPNSVTSIEYWAFSHCYSLTSVSTPDSVTSIGVWAYSGCSSLTSVSIPNSVTDIGDYAFSECSSLTSVSIPNSVTSIGRSAFSWCGSLTSVSIPNSVTSIERYAFTFCSSLTSVTIGNSVTSIGNYAFLYCPLLSEITLSCITPPSLGDYALGDYGNIALVHVPCGTTDAYRWMSIWNSYSNFSYHEMCSDSN